MKLLKCQPEANSDERFEYCIDLMSIIEDNRPNVKGIVVIDLISANYIVAKQGDYRYKGLAFNYCPFCGEAIRRKPAELPSSKI